MGYGLLIVISAVISYLTIIPQYFPSFGLSLSFVTLASLILYCKKNKQAFDWLYYGITVVLSLFLLLRTNPFIVFIDTIAIFYFGSLLILNQPQRNSLHFITALFLPFKLLLKATKTENKFTFDWSQLISRKKIKDDKVKDFIVSLLLGAFVLLIIIPLLSYANPIFRNYVNQFLAFFNISHLFENLFGQQFMVYFGRLVLFGLLVILLPRLLSYVFQKNEVEEKKKVTSLPLFMPMLLTAVVLGIFFLTQIQLYTASASTLKTLGITHSEYAREVFAQLSIVVFIIFVLVYNDQQKNQLTRMLSYILIIEGIFLTLIAAKSDFDYTSQFGFTHKRLWGFTGVLWFMGLFSLFIYREAKALTRSLFVRDLIIFSGLVLLAVNIVNFDSIIYNYSKSRTGEGVDYWYLANNLSADSYAYKNLSGHVYEQARKIKGDDFFRKYGPINAMYWKILNLQEKYEHLDWRSFNYTEYIQYQDIKDLKMDEFEKLLNNQALD